MKIAILHLSDIHIDIERHPVLRRADRIARAIAGTRYELEHLIILISGDIAQSGTAKQYELAGRFLRELEAALTTEFLGVKTSFVFVPGNHDCDLTNASDVRQPEIIEAKIATLDPDGELVKHFLAVQEQFFKFAAEFEGESLATSRARLCRNRIVQCGSTTLRFCCFNTAWLTQNPERPARLYFPVKLLEELGPSVPSSVTISVFHHPYNWLNPVNAQQFKQAVEDMSDLMVTGHEHTPDVYSKRRSPDEIVLCIEGGALWEPSARTSAFNLLLFEFPASEYSMTSFRWDEGKYLPKLTRPWGSFEHNIAARVGVIENSQRFRDKLNDLGTGFSHRHSLKNLTLADLFVYPDLVKRLFAVRTATTPKMRIRAGTVLDFMWEHKHVLVLGESKSGKTSLARTLYIDLQRRGLIPLLVDGRDLRGSEDDILAVLDKVYSDQYSKDTLELYKQKPKAEKLLIIDDLDHSRLSVDQQYALLPLLHRVADRIIAFVDGSTFHIAEIAAKTGKRPFSAYEQCELVPFAPSLRRALIRKWVSVGTAISELTPDQVEREVKTRDNILALLLPKQSLPPFPINILGLIGTAPRI
jgi:predicted phosphodiesterase